MKTGINANIVIVRVAGRRSGRSRTASLPALGLASASVPRDGRDPRTHKRENFLEGEEKKRTEKETERSTTAASEQGSPAPPRPRGGVRPECAPPGKAIRAN